MAARRAKVYYNDRFAGILEEGREGYLFKYDNDYLNMEAARPISLTMPLEQKIFHGNSLFPFFRNLISEGWLLDLNARTLKIDEHDEFGMLIATGADCVGAVSVIPDKRGL